MKKYFTPSQFDISYEKGNGQNIKSTCLADNAWFYQSLQVKLKKMYNKIGLVAELMEIKANSAFNLSLTWSWGWAWQFKLVILRPVQIVKVRPRNFDPFITNDSHVFLH